METKEDGIDGCTVGSMEEINEWETIERSWEMNE